MIEVAEKEYWVAVDHSVIIDDEGRTVDGLSRNTLTENGQVRKAVKRGQLIPIPDSEVEDDVQLEINLDGDAAEDSQGDTSGTSEQKDSGDEKMTPKKTASTTKTATKKEK